MSLEGSANRKATFAIGCFAGMLVWQSLGKLKPALTEWRDLWVLLVAVIAFVIARALTPRSQRLFDRAKNLQETTYVGDWRKPRTEDQITAARAHPRLQKAERLYHECLVIQERLTNEAEGPADKNHHQCNIIVAHSQLALLSMMTGRLTEAKQRAREAVRLARSLSAAREDYATLAALSEALFRQGQAEQLLGDHTAAVRHVQDALAIDERLGNSESARYARLLLEELTAKPSEAV